MPMIRQRVTQSGVDTDTLVQLPLVALDGKSGYQFVGMEAYWSNGRSAVAADWQISAKLQTTSFIVNFDQDELIKQIDWGLQNTAGVAVAVPFEPQKFYEPFEPRVTVQPQIYVGVWSAATGQANVIDFRVYYETVKLTELEYLRMLTGGA